MKSMYWKLPVTGGTRGLVMILTATLLAAAGCSEDPAKPEPAPQGPDRSSKMGLVQYFAQAHEDEDLAQYEECLHEDYQFWFSEDDCGDPTWDWARWIGKIEDLQITENMFNAEDVTEIRITFFNETNVEGAENDQDRFHTGTVTVLDSVVTYYRGDFRLDMHVIVDTGDEDLDHFVDGRADIYLLEDPSFPGLWTIWKVQDRGNVHLKTDETTWSGVKAMYRE